MDKIKWHPNGTPGPWEVSKGSDQYIRSTGKWVASTMGVIGAIGATNARAIAEVPAMVRAHRATNAHLELMQAAVIEHLKPDGDLIDKDAFINRIIYLLDGPEQRALQDSVRAILARIDKDA